MALSVAFQNVNGIRNVQQSLGKVQAATYGDEDIVGLVDTRLNPKGHRMLKKIAIDYHVYSAFRSDGEPSRGVSLLIKKSSVHDVRKVYDDPAGNLLLVRVAAGEEHFLLGAYYGPSGDYVPTYRHLFNRLRGSVEPGEAVIVGGDFNLTFDQELDTEGYVRPHKEKSREYVKMEMQAMGLKDSFREANGERRHFTWERFAGDKRARLDHVLVSGTMLDTLSAVETRHSPIQGFDHKAVIACFGTKMRTPAPYFKAREGMEDDHQYREMMMRAVDRVMKENLEDAEYHRVRELDKRQKAEATVFTAGWRAAPEFVLQQALQECRQITASYSKAKDTQRKEERRRLLNDLTLWEERRRRADTLENNVGRHKAQLELEAHLEKEGIKKFRSNPKVKKLAQERPEKLFLNQTQPPMRRHTVQKAKHPDGTTTEDQLEIMETFHRFWASIYERQVEPDLTLMPTLTSLDDDQADTLGRPVTFAELTKALHGMKNGTPGKDGFRTRWYRALWETLGPLVQDAFASAWDKGKLPDFMMETVITLLPKDKETENPAKYRPISLQPTIFKLFGTVFANRVKPLMEKLCRKEQKAYIKGRQMQEVQLNVSSKIQAALREGREAWVMSLDFKKAFDYMSHEYLHKMMISRNLGQNFVKAAMMTVVGRRAQVKVNERLSQPMKMLSGVGQGDTFAPYIFLLGVDALLQMIEDDPEILPAAEGFSKAEGYADDATPTCSAYEGSLEALRKQVEHFCRLSTMEVNWDKTEVTPIGQPIGRDPCGLRVSSTYKLLGTWFDGKGEVLERNYQEKFKKMEGRIKSWNKQTPTIRGRVLIANAVLSSVFNHLVSFPSRFSEKYALKVQSSLNKYIHKGSHKMRIEESILHEKDGGAGLVDVRRQWLMATVRWLAGDADLSESWRKDVGRWLGQEPTLFEAVRAMVNLEGWQNQVAKDTVDLMWFKKNQIASDDAVENPFGWCRRRTFKTVPDEVRPLKANLKYGLQEDWYPGFSGRNWAEFDLWLSQQPRTTRPVRFAAVASLAQGQEGHRFSFWETVRRHKKGRLKKREKLNCKNKYLVRAESLVDKLRQRWSKNGIDLTLDELDQILDVGFLKDRPKYYDFMFRLGRGIVGFRDVVSRYNHEVRSDCLFCQGCAHTLRHVFCDCEETKRILMEVADKTGLPAMQGEDLIRGQQGLAVDRWQRVQILQFLWLHSLEESTTPADLANLCYRLRSGEVA